MNIIEKLKDRIEGKAPKGARRSPEWKDTKTKHLKQYPACAVCGCTKNVEVHHIIPFHIAPDMELNPDNLLTLCECKKYGINCHLLIGHLGNYRRTNTTCRIDAVMWNMKLKGKL